MKLRPGTAREAGMSPERVAHIVSLAQGWVERGITPALVVLVARKGVIVIHEAFGHLTPAQDSPPLRQDTIFPLGSLTKPITATAAMILVEDGLLGLNRPVQWYIPEFTGEGKDAVMVHHLLTHTWGLGDEDMEAYDPHAFAEKRACVEIPSLDETEHPLIHQYLHLRYDIPLRRPPGKEMAYCSPGYEMLGEIVRRVSGVAFAEFCPERIFQPLGMADTHFFVPDSAASRIVQRPPDAPAADIIASLGIGKVPWALGGAHSTAIDVAVFGQMFLNGGTYGDARILSPASVAEMTRNQIPRISAQFEGINYPEASWGLGWGVHGSKKALAGGTLHSPRAFGHGGAGGAYMWVDPAYEIVGVYLSVISLEQLPANVPVPEAFRPRLIRYQDLLINAVTAAIIDA